MSVRTQTQYRRGVSILNGNLSLLSGGINVECTVTVAQLRISGKSITFRVVLQHLKWHESVRSYKFCVLGRISARHAAVNVQGSRF